MNSLKQYLSISLLLLCCATACKNRNLVVVEDLANEVVADDVQATQVLTAPDPSSLEAPTAKTEATSTGEDAREETAKQNDKMGIAGTSPILQYFHKESNGDYTARTVDGIISDITYEGKAAKQILLSDNTTIICEEQTVDGETVLYRIGGDAPANPR